MERRASNHVLSLSLSLSLSLAPSLFGLPLYPAPFATPSLPPSHPGSLHRSPARYRISWPTAKNQFPRFFPPARRIRRQHHRRFHRFADKAKKLRGLPPMTSRPCGVRIVAFHFCKLFRGIPNLWQLPRNTITCASDSIETGIPRRRLTAFVLPENVSRLAHLSRPIHRRAVKRASRIDSRRPLSRVREEKRARKRARATRPLNSFYSDSGPRSRPSKLSGEFCGRRP